MLDVDRSLPSVAPLLLYVEDKLNTFCKISGRVVTSRVFFDEGIRQATEALETAFEVTDPGNNLRGPPRMGEEEVRELWCYDFEVRMRAV